jgi:hypothetical protein
MSFELGAWEQVKCYCSHRMCLTAFVFSSLSNQKYVAETFALSHMHADQVTGSHVY